ncbi:MAG: VacJ family lipoprotein [Deltaproteobacteria bacterium]|nr:VacJ family lipoprotein [Deltaproteobacteria bacterium]
MARILLAALLSVSTFSGAVIPNETYAQAKMTTEDAASARPKLGAEEPPTPPTPDPLEWFNQPVFEFNLKLDEYALRPVATAYDTVMPDAAQRGVQRFFKNLGIVERFANNLFQGKVPQAGQEVGRFVINTTIGGVGFLDVADEWLGWKEHPEDFGQTLAVYGVGSGPYVMLPFFGPSTVRDAVGLVADGAMNPMAYFLSTVELIAVRGGLAIGSAVNYRSMNLELFEDVNRYTVDLYGAVQDGYLQRREKQIAE